MFLINGFLIVNLKNNDSLNELNAWINRITSFCCLLKFYRLFKNNKELKIVTCNNMWLFNKTERKFLAIIVSINALFIRVNYIKMYVNTCVWIIYYEIQLFKQIKLHVEHFTCYSIGESGIINQEWIFKYLYLLQ